MAINPQTGNHTVGENFIAHAIQLTLFTVKRISASGKIFTQDRVMASEEKKILIKSSQPVFLNVVKSVFVL